MKNLISTLLVFLAPFLMSCSKNGEEPLETMLKLAGGASSSINVKANETSVNFFVFASSTPSVSSDASWVSGKATLPNTLNNTSRVDLIIQPNTSDSERIAHIILTVGDKSLEVTLTQQKPVTEEPIQPAPEDPSPSVGHAPWINPEPSVIEGSTPREVALSLGVGWNLGNQMDAYNNGVSSETAWGNPKATQSLFDALKAKGFSTVRIPVTWLGHIGAAPDYKIDENWLNRVVELVSMAEKAGLNAIVNMHHDGADSHYWLDIKNAATDPAKNEQIKNQIAAMWGQIAEAMKDKGNFLMFEAFNEIHDGGWGWGDNRKDNGKQYNCLNEWNQTFVDAVRATGGNNSTRWLSVPSYVTNIDLAVNGSMVLPKDPAGKVMVSVHFYDPNDFALNSKVTDWGHTGDNSKKGGAIQDEDYIRAQFAKLTEYWVNKGVPVYIGETGPSNQATPRGKAFRNYYLEYMHRAAREAGLSAMYWDNGAVGAGTDKFALFNHGDGSVVNDSEEAINAMLTGGTCRDEDYNLSTIYDSAPVF